jgi:hypothetical protein
MPVSATMRADANKNRQGHASSCQVALSASLLGTRTSFGEDTAEGKQKSPGGVCGGQLDLTRQP